MTFLRILHGCSAPSQFSISMTSTEVQQEFCHSLVGLLRITRAGFSHTLSVERKRHRHKGENKDGQRDPADDRPITPQRDVRV